MKIEELVKDLDPVSIIEFKNYLLENLSELCCRKNSNSKVISSHRHEDLFCKKCGCKYYKNGKTKIGVQKYICSGCKNTFSETTDTIIHYSKLPFEIWSNIIDNLLNGFSIRRIAEENNISVLTFFRIRHKILIALTTFIKKINYTYKEYMEHLKLTKDYVKSEKNYEINYIKEKTFKNITILLLKNNYVII